MGAKAAGHWQGAHATPIDSTYPDVEIGSKANRYGYPYGITVNTLGQRFFDEGEARHSYTYAKTGWAVLGQPQERCRRRNVWSRRAASTDVVEGIAWRWNSTVMGRS